MRWFSSEHARVSFAVGLAAGISGMIEKLGPVGWDDLAAGVILGGIFYLLGGFIGTRKHPGAWAGAITLAIAGLSLSFAYQRDFWVSVLG